MNYKNLTEKELLEIANTQGLHNREINKEWVRRYGMNFPYRLDRWNRILNCLSLKIMHDADCDKLVLRQAHGERERRKRS